MLFMGQEWAANTPFLYFTDMPRELGEAIRAGRRREFLHTEFATEDNIDQMADPQAEETFTRSKLDWIELDQPEHRRVLSSVSVRVEASPGAVRREQPAARMLDRPARRNGPWWSATKSAAGWFLSTIISRAFRGRRPGKILLRSNAPEFGGDLDPSQPETAGHRGVSRVRDKTLATWRRFVDFRCCRPGDR